MRDQLTVQVRTVADQGRLDEFLPFTGQSAALVHDIAPAEVLIERLMAEAEQTLHATGRWIQNTASIGRTVAPQTLTGE